MFKKKEEVEEQEETKTEDAEEIKQGEQQKPALTERDKDLLKLINAYKEKYENVYDAHDFFGVSQTFVEAEKLNLQFAIYSELVELKKEIKNLRQNGQD